jgi:hypothetical protein
MVTKRHRHRSIKGAALAEFGPVLWLFLLLFLIPFFDLISFGTAVGAIMYTANMGARAASGAATFSDALNDVKNLDAACQPFLKMACCVPTAGAGQPGTKVVCVVAPMDGSSGPAPFTGPGAGGSMIPVTTPDVNSTAVPAQFNTTNCIYQYVVTSSYQVMPIFNFSATNILHNIPALGSPVTVQYSATSTVDHPEGLNN